MSYALFDAYLKHYLAIRYKRFAATGLNRTRQDRLRITLLHLRIPQLAFFDCLQSARKQILKIVHICIPESDRTAIVIVGAVPERFLILFSVHCGWQM